MLADEVPQTDFLRCLSPGGAGVGIFRSVEDADAFYGKARGAGGIELLAVQDQFYGGRAGTMLEPVGRVWTIGTQFTGGGREKLLREPRSLADWSDT
jgi:PhnB protein